MIEGFVNSHYQPVITLTVQGQSGQTHQLDVVVDTGFNDFLTLPHELVSQLELPFESRIEMTLADGEEVNLDVHNARIQWDGQLKEIQACMTDGIPLVGMLMLDGYDLNVEVKVGGRVRIEARE